MVQGIRIRRPIRAGSRTAAVLGCGFGRREATGDFARGFAARCPLPLLIDADGLYFMARDVLAAGRALETIAKLRVASQAAAEVAR